MKANNFMKYVLARLQLDYHENFVIEGVPDKIFRFQEDGLKSRNTRTDETCSESFWLEQMILGRCKYAKQTKVGTFECVLVEQESIAKGQEVKFADIAAAKRMGSEDVNDPHPLGANRSQRFSLDVFKLMAKEKMTVSEAVTLLRATEEMIRRAAVIDYNAIPHLFKDDTYKHVDAFEEGLLYKRFYQAEAIGHE